MAQKIGERELALKAMTERNAAKPTKAPRAGQTKPIKAWRDMTDAEREEHMRDPQGILARAKAEGRELTEDRSSKPSTPPVKASAQPTEKPMAKKAKAKTKKHAAARAKKTRSAAPKAKKAAASGDDNKTAVVIEMLKSTKGCTSAEVCEKTGWAAVSIPPIAKRAGLKLRKEPEGRAIRYFGEAA